MRELEWSMLKIFSVERYLNAEKIAQVVRDFTERGAAPFATISIDGWIIPGEELEEGNRYPLKGK